MLMIAPDQSTVMSSLVQGGTIQWMSPELLHPEGFGLKKSRPTKESDLYALGMVVYEVLSGRTPFGRIMATVIIFKVVGGERPERPQGDGGKLFTDAIWSVLQRCWKPEPSDRPSTKAVLQCLGGSPSLSRQSSGVDGVGETDTDVDSDTSTNDSGVSPPSTRDPGLPIPLQNGGNWNGRVGRPACVWTALGVMYRQEVSWTVTSATLGRVGRAGIEDT